MYTVVLSWKCKVEELQEDFHNVVHKDTISMVQNIPSIKVPDETIAEVQEEQIIEV